MPKRSLGRLVAVFSGCMLLPLTWAVGAAADDPPAPQATSPAPAQGEKKPDPDQDKLAQNSVFAEGLGAAILYSVNYERMVIDQLGVRVGLSYFAVGATANAGGSTSTASASYLFIP